METIDHPLCVGNVEMLVRILGTSDSVGVAMCTLAVGYRPCSSPGALPPGNGVALVQCCFS